MAETANPSDLPPIPAKRYFTIGEVIHDDHISIY